MRLVLVPRPCRPFAGEIDLRRGGHREGAEQDQDKAGS
jgi:hypothetical protein